MPWCWDAEQLAGTGEVLDAPAIGKKAVVADAVEALGQDVNEEAADELRLSLVKTLSAVKNR